MLAFLFGDRTHSHVLAVLQVLGHLVGEDAPISTVLVQAAKTNIKD